MQIIYNSLFHMCNKLLIMNGEQIYLNIIICFNAGQFDSNSANVIIIQQCIKEKDIYTNILRFNGTCLLNNNPLMELITHPV